MALTRPCHYTTALLYRRNDDPGFLAHVSVVLRTTPANISIGADSIGSLYFRWNLTLDGKFFSNIIPDCSLNVRVLMLILVYHTWTARPPSRRNKRDRQRELE